MQQIYNFMGLSFGNFWSLFAQTNCNPDGVDLENTQCDTIFPQVTADSNTVQGIFSVVFYVIGAVAVIMIIIGSITMVTSGGDSQKVGKARETITYSAIGLVVAISAQLIIYFLLGSI